MPKICANLSMLFTEVDFLDRFERAAKAGFKGVEYISPYDFDAVDIKQRLIDNNLQQVLFNLPAGDWKAGERGIGCHPDRVDEFKTGVDKAIKYAAALGCDQCNALAGIVPPDISPQLAHHTFVENLRYAAPKFEQAGIRLLVEAINTFDMPGFFLTNTKQAISLIEEVGSNNLFYQYDIYHMQRMEGELCATIAANLKNIAHMQLADNPGRHEPGTGEINYENIFSAIDKMGYAGWVGAEYIPTNGTEQGLEWMKKLAAQGQP